MAALAREQTGETTDPEIRWKVALAESSEQAVHHRHPFALAESREEEADHREEHDAL